jgi:hypothetical protein
MWIRQWITVGNVNNFDENAEKNFNTLKNKTFKNQGFLVSRKI